MTCFTTFHMFTIVSLVLICCSSKYEEDAVSCDFQKDLCGWQSARGPVYSDRRIGVCGFGGSQERCYITQSFQYMQWIRTDIQSMLHHFPVSVRKMISEIGSIFVLCSTRTTAKDTIQVNDIMSAEIPLSMEHRCLRYKHLVIGNASALVVGYIKDYLEPFDLSHVLNTHPHSSVTTFSTGSVTLPVGSKFKVVFRSLYLQSEYALVLIHSVSISSGICEKCGPSEFSCSSTREECIPLKKVCDSKPDCLNGEDEERCGESINVGSSCQNNKETPGLKNTSTLFGDNITIMEDKDDVDHMKSNGDFFRKGQNCSANFSNQSYFCPPNCTCSSLALNCSSAHNIPAYITSVTLHNLVQERLNFSARFSSLKKIQITSCKSCDLYIQNTVAVNEITINSSDFQTVEIDDRNNYLHQLSIFDSSLGKMIFSPTFDHYFELNIQNSALNATVLKIPMLWGKKVDLSQTRGFPNSIERYDHLVINYSSCDLTELPKADLKTVTLDLRKNKLRNCQILYYTQILYLQHNQFEYINISVDTRQSEARLQYLDVSYNNIKKIDRTNFEGLPNLLYLKLNNNHMIYIHNNAFSKTIHLVHLDLSNNEIRFLTRDHFIRLTSLQHLNLQNNNLNVVEGMFDGLISIQYLLVDYYTLCCAQPQAKGRVQCLAPVNEISSCDHLIDTPFLGIVIWYIALVAVFGNICGTLYRYIMTKRKSVSSFALYSINLGVADFLMGVYLYIIAGANLTFSGRYGFADEWWRHSHICTLAGVLATLSSESSALFVLLITIDRIHIIRSPFSKLKTNGRVSKFLSGLVWTIALLLSVLPLLGNDYFYDYYSGSGICISLPLSVQRKSGWEYSMIVFVGANFFIFIGILIGQVMIFTTVVSAGTKLQTNQSTRKGKEMSLAKILIAVAVTDMLCWIPIGVFGFLTFNGVDISPKVYAWVVVVILPINSALNPIIYTFSAVIRKMKWKSNERQNTNNTNDIVLKEKSEA